MDELLEKILDEESGGNKSSFSELKDMFHSNDEKPFVQDGVILIGYRSGSVDKNPRGIFFASDEAGAEAYAVFHPGEPVKQYKITLKNVLVAGHQNSVCKLFFNKSYQDLHYDLSRKSKSESGGGHALDRKIRAYAIRKKYSGIVYTRPAAPAKMELVVFSGDIQEIEAEEELLEKLMVEDWKGSLARTAAAGIIGGAAMLGGVHKAASEKPAEKPVAARQVEQPASKVDMQKIASMESSNDPKAENTRTGARGLTQIMQPTWEEVVDKMGEDWSWDEAFDGDKNLAVGSYYMNIEIPRLLKHYGIEDTVENRLAAYNWGVGNLKSVGIEKAPQETINYIEKYRD